MLEWCEQVFGGDVRVRITAAQAGIRTIEFHPAGTRGEPNDRNPLLREAVEQLKAYFAADLRAFDLPLDMAGTEFQKRVWCELLNIPYGKIRSYLQVAEAIGAPHAVRAVGAANGANPIAIVVPCHRVIGASGKLTGYGGGLPLKRRLLDLESGNMLLGTTP
jgi:methylated-DNA-[protein]-cysteine S-methyltransferase